MSFLAAKLFNFPNMRRVYTKKRQKETPPKQRLPASQAEGSKGEQPQERDVHVGEARPKPEHEHKGEHTHGVRAGTDSHRKRNECACKRHHGNDEVQRMHEGLISFFHEELL